MNELSDIRQPVQKEMEEFNAHFRSSIASHIPLVNLLTRFVLKQKGKQMRPLFVFLSSKMTGTVGPSTYTAASLIELMHTATLIHDDIVDDSNERRGMFSVKAIWKTKVAVLLGDYLLAQGLLLSVKNKEYKLLEIVSDASREMSEGELLQIQKTRNLNTDIETYYEVIRKKTASLIASCMASGASSSGADQSVIDHMYDTGIEVGLSFQIKDDLFDYQKHSITGKPSGNDIKEKKFTLPLIYALQQAGETEKRTIIRNIKRGKGNRKTVNEIVSFVKKYGGIEYAQQQMIAHKEKALAALDQYEASPSREALKGLVEFTVSRRK